MPRFHAQSTIFYASSEAARAELALSLMRMRSLDEAIQAHLCQAEALHRALSALGTDAAPLHASGALAPAGPTATNDEGGRRQRTHCAKRPRATSPPTDDASALGEAASTRPGAASAEEQHADMVRHREWALYLSQERLRMSANAVHCAQDVFQMLTARMAHLERALALNGH